MRRWYNVSRAYRSELTRAKSSFDVVLPELSATKSDGRVLTYRAPLRLNCDLPSSELESQAPALSAGLERIARSRWGQWLTSQSGFRDLVLEFDYDRPAGTKFDPTVVKGLQRSFEENVLKTHPTLRAHWTGEALFHQAMFDGNQQVSGLNGVVIVFLVVALTILTGAVQAGILYAISLIWMGGIVFGAMAHFGIPFDPLVSSIFLMVTVASLEDFTFICWNVLKEGGTWRSAPRRVMLPGVLTSLTTFVGFISLGMSDQGMIDRFGYWCGVGAALECLFTYIVMPAISQQFRWFRTIANPKRAIGPDFLDRIGRVEFPSWVNKALFALMPIALGSLVLLKLSDAPLDFFPKTHPLRQTVSYLEKTRGWSAPIFMIFDNSEAESTNRKVLEKVKKVANVVAVESPYTWTDELTEGLEPLTAAMVTRELRQSELFKQWISPTFKLRATLYLKETDYDAIKKVVGDVEKICKGQGCVTAGSFVAYTEFMDRVPATLIESFLMSFFLVSCIIVWICLATKRASIFSTLVCGLWGPLMVFMVIAFAKIPINLVTCTFAAIVVGIGGDNAIQFLLADGLKQKDKVREGLDRRSGASFLCALVMGTTALLFCFSYFVPHRTFGILLGLAMIFLLIGEVFIFRSLQEKSTR